MKNKVRYSPKARKDLKDIREYIKVDLCNPIAAKNTMSRILYAVKQLEDFPLSGIQLTSEMGFNSGYWYLAAGKYLIFYHVTGQNVYVDRILHGSRDYMRILFGSRP